MFKPTIKNLFLFFVVWGAVGFILGTEILMGPSRWVAEFCRANSEYARWESPLIRTLMVLLVAITLPAAIFLTSHLINTVRTHVRAGIVIILACCLGMTLYFWLNPDKFNVPKAMDTVSTERFVVGPYPDIDQLKELKKQGFAGVISLLHPAVVPFEPKLIADESANAKAAGIEMIHLPMLPWISENKDALDRLAQLASSGTERYYLHCYLGKDRVNVALRTVERVGASVNRSAAEKARRLSGRRSLGRGQLFILEKDLYLSGFPTDEEFLAYIIAAGISNVVSVMDADEDNAGKWIEKERSALSAHNIGFHHMPVKRMPYDASAALKVMDAVLKLDRPVYVHDFKSPSFRLQALIQAYTNRLPCIPPMLMEDKLLVGKVDCLAPNVVAGPRPADLKQFVELEKYGIKSFAYFGATNSAEAIRDHELTSAGQFDWRVIDDERGGSPVMLGTGGPWYVYGSYSADVISAMFGPSYIEPVSCFDQQTDAGAPEEVSESAQDDWRFQELLARIRQRPDMSLTDRCVSFCLNSFPDLKLIILLGPFCLFYTYICAGYAGWLKVTKLVRTPYTRKVFHFLIFTMAGVMQIIAGTPAVILFGSVVACCVLYAILRGDGFAFYEAMARPTDAPKRSLFILIPLFTTALGGVLANIFFQPVAAIGYLVGGWGDAIGEPVGSKWGRHRYTVPSMLGVPATRSMEGSLAVTIAGFLAALLGLYLLGVPLAMAVWMALICSAACALVEAVSTHGMDNLTVQLAAAAIVFYLLR